MPVEEDDSKRLRYDDDGGGEADAVDNNEEFDSEEEQDEGERECKEQAWFQHAIAQAEDDEDDVCSEYDEDVFESFEERYAFEFGGGGCEHIARLLN